jgi:hypothetical protein
MNKPVELRTENARLFLIQGLRLQRVRRPAPESVRLALEWCFEIASSGEPLPPVCLVADLGHMAFDPDWDGRGPRELEEVPGFPHELLRMYEDHVLGKVLADWTFQRASDALRHYAAGRDRARGLAFVLQRFRENAGFGGVELSPGVIKTLLDMPPEEVHAAGWESLSREGPMPVLVELYEGVITQSRRTAEVISPVDLFELEHGTALKDLSERLLLRQVLHTAQRMDRTLPTTRVRPLAGRQEVPTRVLDEDTYPVGGFSSLSTHGSIESLLHSQLAFMEPHDRPDLFDIKFLRNELLYYARDENQFLRRRRTFTFVLYPDLVHARFKDAALPVQRVVLLWALIYVTVARLTDWLSTDALTFVFNFLPDDEGEAPLEAERELAETLFREGIANGHVEVLPKRAAEGEFEMLTEDDVRRQCALRARRSLVQCLLVSTEEQELSAQETVVTRLRLDSPVPAMGTADEPLPASDDVDDAEGAWYAALRQLLQRWV